MCARSDVMDALAAQLLTYKGGPKGGAGGGGGDDGDDTANQQAQTGIPFVRIDGSHDSSQVGVLVTWCVCVRARVCVRLFKCV